MLDYRAILIPKWTNDSPNDIHHLQEDWQYKYMYSCTSSLSVPVLNFCK